MLFIFEAVILLLWHHAAILIHIYCAHGI